MIKNKIFAFAIPLISKRNSRNWQITLDLLSDTLNSALNQSDPNFMILLCCNDAIDIPLLKDRRLIVSIITDPATPDDEQASVDIQLKDFGHKKNILTQLAEDHNASYLMYLDADDLVHHDLVKWVREADPTYGCILRSGLIMDYISRKYITIPGQHIGVSHFDILCGSSIILTLPEAENRQADWPAQYMSKGHHFARQCFIDSGCAAVDINECAVIYTVNASVNLTDYDRKQWGGSKFRQQIVNEIAAHGMEFNAALKAEFSLGNGNPRPDFNP